MNPVVIGTSIGYNVEQLLPFVISLRKFYTGRVLLVVDAVTKELESFFKENNIDTHTIILPNGIPRAAEIFNIRHIEYLKIVEGDDFSHDRVFITDVRDVLFQGNPFDHPISSELEFFAEPKEILNCSYNTKKISKAFGEIEFLKLKNEKIICAGTTIGTKTGMIKYLNKMISVLTDYRERTGNVADDQAVHNFLIYNNHFENFKIYDTGNGPIATLHHLREGIFNEAGQVINIDGTIPAVVHQWDRLENPYKKNLYNTAITK